MSEPITNHVALAIARLPEQYKHSPKLIDLITCYVNRIQELEDAFIAIRDKTGLLRGRGAALDLMGTVLGKDRTTGQSDDDYVLDLRVALAENTSQGTPNEIINIFKLLSIDADCEIVEVFPAIFGVLTTVALDGSLATKIREALTAAAPLGVRCDYIEQYDGDFAFTLGDAADFPELDANRGLGDALDPTNGGRLGQIIA